MHNFKIAHANLKDPNISSLRMNHFKIAHISTWLATVTLKNFLPVNHNYSFGTVENSTDNKKYLVLLEIFSILKIDKLTPFSQTKKPKRPTIQKNTQNKDTISKRCMIDNLLLKITLYNCHKPSTCCQLLYLNLYSYNETTASIFGIT